uniref:BLOC-1 related complex subunit 8 n=1 Tax=Xiphophorus couchianus TaxID=32473 RepID=A0A3B5LS24_9TELE
MDDQEMQLKVRRVSDKFTESMYVLANEPSVALYRLQEHVRRSLPELVQHKTDMQSWEEQSQGAIYSVEYACSAVKSMTNSSVYFKNIDTLLRQTITMKEQISNFNGRRYKHFVNMCINVTRRKFISPSISPSTVCTLLKYLKQF